MSRYYVEWKLPLAPASTYQRLYFTTPGYYPRWRYTKGETVGTVDTAHLDETRAWAKRRGLTLRFKLQDPTPHVAGDEGHLDPELLMGLERVAARAGRVIEIISGWRSYAEQVVLWLRYLAGGNLAARPGTSEHEGGADGLGDAADCYVNGVAFWTWCDRNGLRNFAYSVGLRQTVLSEPWHVGHAHRR